MPEPVSIDKSKFEQLYRLHWHQVRDYCFHHTHDIFLAEEIVQDIFLSIWERRAEVICTDSNFAGYLLRSAKFKIFDFHRHCAIVNKHLESVGVSQRTSDLETAFLVRSRELQDGLSQLLSTMSATRRQIYHLANERGLSKTEIASEVGLSEKSVEYHLYKSFSEIRLWIESQEK